MPNHDFKHLPVIDPELDELLHPKKTRKLLAAALAGGVVLITANLVSIILLLNAYGLSDSDLNLESGAWEDLPTNFPAPDQSAPLTGEEPALSPAQAETWLKQNHNSMAELAKTAARYPELTTLWLASAEELQTSGIYVWINMIPYAAEPDTEEGYKVFTEALQNISVPVMEFYQITKLMKQCDIESYNLYTGSNEPFVIELYHSGYDCIFYNSFYGGPPSYMGVYSNEKEVHLYDNWWFSGP